ALAADGIYVKHGSQGPLIIKGVLFENSSPTNNLSIAVGADSPTSSGALVAIGCSFPNSNPFSNVGAQRRIVLGCNYEDSSAQAYPLDDQIFGLGANNFGTFPSPERLRVGNAFITNNTFGVVTISGTASSAAVTFAKPEPDSSYKVMTTVDSIIGAFSVTT